MASVLAIQEFAGYIPTKDPRQLQSAAILDGQNFIHDIYGPRAGFANQIRFSQPLDSISRQHVSELRCGDDLFYGTATGVLRLDSESKLWYPLFDVTIENPKWPWTVAYVGKKYYFAQYEIGLWEYDPSAGTIRHVKTPLYDRAIWVCAAFGRLIMLTTTYVSWSAQDDGGDLTPMLSTGAGAQGISLVGGTAYRVDPVVNGVIVATDRGLMKGTKVDESYVFSWHVVSSDLRIMSPTCACSIPDAGVIYCDYHGLRYVANIDTSSTYTTLQPWEAEIGQVFLREFLQSARSKVPGDVMLHYSYNEQAVFVAFSMSGPHGLFNKAYAYKVPSGKWGVFNEQFTGLLDMPDDFGVWRGGYIDAQGFLRRFNYNKYKDELLTEASFEHIKYHKAAGGDVTLHLTDTVNLRAEDSSTGDITYTLTQDTCYTVDEELFIDEAQVSLFPNTVKSGFYGKVKQTYTSTIPVNESGIVLTSGIIRVTGTSVQTEPQSAAILSGSLSQTEPQSGTIFDGKFNQSVFDEYIADNDIGLGDCGFVRYELSASPPAKTDLQSSITFGPLRIVAKKDVPETCSFTRAIFGLEYMGTSSTTVDWNAGSTLITEDWSSGTTTIEIDYGVQDPTQYTFSLTTTMSRDSYAASTQYSGRGYPIVKTMYSLTFSIPQYCGSFGLFTIATESEGDYFYLKYAEISGISNGASY